MIPDRIRVNVPFSFIAGTTRLPAGEYEISTPNVNSDYTLLIREVNGHGSALVQTMPVSSEPGMARKTELVFDRVGKACGSPAAISGLISCETCGRRRSPSGYFPT